MQDRREFFRIHHSQAVQFKACRPGKAPGDHAQSDLQGVSRNISEAGILFQTSETPPEISSIVWMNVNFRTLSICKEIESRALVFNNGLLGRVVRVEEAPKTPNEYAVGVCFVTQTESCSKEIQEILSEIT